MIIYQDKNILAINKPAGLIVHEARNLKHKTLTDWLIKNYPETKTVGDPSTNSGQVNLRPGIVHRLDKDTSGVLIVARNQKTFEFLKEQFKSRKIKKTYIALVKGLVNKNGIIDTPIQLYTKSRNAFTKYIVLEKFVTKPDESGKYTLLEVYPKTGRTHQIRIHLKSINHPIVCDKLYSYRRDLAKNEINCPFGLTRHFLHAQSLELSLPNKSRIKLEADLPDDLKDVLKSLKECAKK